MDYKMSQKRWCDRFQKIASLNVFVFCCMSSLLSLSLCCLSCLTSAVTIQTKQTCWTQNNLKKKTVHHSLTSSNVNSRKTKLTFIKLKTLIWANIRYFNLKSDSWFKQVVFWRAKIACNWTQIHLNLTGKHKLTHLGWKGTHSSLRLSCHRS